MNAPAIPHLIMMRGTPFAQGLHDNVCDEVIRVPAQPVAEHPLFAERLKLVECQLGDAFVSIAPDPDTCCAIITLHPMASSKAFMAINACGFEIIGRETFAEVA